MLLLKTQFVRLSWLHSPKFLHSILFFKRKRQQGLLCSFRRGIRCDWYRTQCERNKNGTCSLTTCAPRFLFLEGSFHNFYQRLIQRFGAAAGIDQYHSFLGGIWARCRCAKKKPTALTATTA